MKNIRKNRVKRNIFYIIFFIVMFILQTTPNLLAINMVKPLLMIPTMVLIPVFEDEFVGGIYAAFAGLLCDMSSFLVFGLNAAFLLIMGVGIGLIIKFWLQPSFFTHLIFSGIATFIMLNIQFVFGYGIWRLDLPVALYLRKVVATTIYTTLISPVIYFIFKKITDKLNLYQVKRNRMII